MEIKRVVAIITPPLGQEKEPPMATLFHNAIQYIVSHIVHQVNQANLIYEEDNVHQV